MLTHQGTPRQRAGPSRRGTLVMAMWIAMRFVGVAGVAVALLGGAGRHAHAAPLAYQQSVLASGPFAYYRLGEISATTAADASGNNHSATYHGGFTQNQPGAAGTNSDRATAFDGTSGYVSVDDQLGTSASGFGGRLGAGFSTEFIFSTTATNTEQLAGALNSTSAHQFTVALAVSLNVANDNTAAPGAARLFLRGEDGFTLSGQVNGNLADGKFHHLAFVYDPTRTADARLLGYVDGSLATTALSYSSPNQTPPGSFANFQNPFGLAAGVGSGGAFNYFKGTLDEAALFDKALSGSQVSAHAQAAALPEPAGLAALAGGVLGLSRRPRPRRPLPCRPRRGAR